MEWPFLALTSRYISDKKLAYIYISDKKLAYMYIFEKKLISDKKYFMYTFDTILSLYTFKHYFVTAYIHILIISGKCVGSKFEK